MRTDVEVVVIGGGVYGCSTAYHLAKKGCRDVLLLEAREIGSQSSSQAAGFIRVHRTSALSTEMALYAIEAFERFREETGHDAGVHQSGAFLVALRQETAARLRPWTERARRYGIESHYLTPAEAKARFPLLDITAVLGAVFEPRDIYLDPAEVAPGYARAARERGVDIRTGTAVRGIEVEGGRVVGVRTDRERIRTRLVALTGGAWGPRLARQCGYALRAVPVQHQLHITAPLKEARPEFPMVRFPDLAIYVRPCRGGLMVGGYEPNPTSFDPEAMTDELDVRRLDPNRQALRDVTKKVTPSVPIFDGAPIAREQQGLPTLTPDGFGLVGKVPGIEGLLVASGDNVGGVSISPTIGHILSDLILKGQAPYDIRPLAVDRFGPAYADPQELRRACEQRYIDFGRNYMALTGKEG